MITYLFYTKGSQSESQMQTLAEDLIKRQVDIELIEADSPKGIDLPKNYDVLARPAIVVAASDGTQLTQWQDVMPSGSDISYWAHN